MNAVTQPVGPKPPPQDHEFAVREWLDALASGRCDQAGFLRSMQERFQSEPEGNWEVLAQLDQYFRRGRIKPETFLAIKTALAGNAMGMSARLGLQVTAPAVAAPPLPKGAVQPATSTRAIEIGDVLRGRYRIVGVLGHGGMGTVFEALDDFRLEAPPTGRRVAVKVLHTSVTMREELLSELRREFQHLQALSHPNVVRVHDFDRDGPLAFFTMELLNGVLLSRVLQARQAVPMPRPLALAVIRDLGAAVAHAHSRGIVHGDINPQNIFLTMDGELRVLDFGASHALKDAAAADGGMAVPFATPAYASCQVLEGGRPEVRDDVFAMACVAYLVLSGVHPFAEGTALGARATGLRPHRPAALTHRQWRALRSGLRFERDKRPADVQQWLRRLGTHDAAEHLPPLAELLKAPAPRRKKLVLAAALLIIVAMMAGAYWVINSQTGWPSPGAAPERTAELPAGAAAAPAQTPAQAAESPERLTDASPVGENASHGEAGRPNEAARPSDAARSSESARLTEAGRSTEGARLTEAAHPGNSQQDHSQQDGEGTVAAAVNSEPTNHIPSAAVPNRTAAAVPAPASAAAPASRIEMATDTMDVAAGSQAARIVVRRRGSVRGAVGFTWWTESGTAKAGLDFTPVSPQVEHFQDGKSSTSLLVSLPVTLRAGPKSFYVVIDQPGDGAKLGARALTMVTLAPAN